MAQGISTPLYSKVFQSSHIHSAVYDPTAHSLQITYTNGRRYVNDPDSPVPIDVWNEFVRTGSPGTFFDREIKPYWGGQELKPGQAAQGSIQQQGGTLPSGFEPGNSQ